MSDYKKAFERIKTFCNSRNGYPYNSYTQSCIPLNNDLKIVEKALQDLSNLEKNKIERITK